MLTGTPPMLLLEYCEGGDLRAALNRDEGGRLGWYNRGRRIALDIAAGLHFLHSHDVRVFRSTSPLACVQQRLQQKQCCCRKHAGSRTYRILAPPKPWQGVGGMPPHQKVDCNANPMVASPQVMHSDLKTKNILLTRNQQTAKIADVGLAQFMGSAYFKSENVAFTLTYAAPELLLNAICSSKVRLEHAAAKPFRMLCDLHKSDLLMLNERSCPPACYQVVLWRSAPIAHIFC